MSSRQSGIPVDMSSSSSSCPGLAEKPFQGKPSDCDLATHARPNSSLSYSQLLPNAKVTTRPIVKKVWGSCFSGFVPGFARIFSCCPARDSSCIMRPKVSHFYSPNVLSLTITRAILKVWLWNNNFQSLKWSFGPHLMHRQAFIRWNYRNSKILQQLHSRITNLVSCKNVSARQFSPSLPPWLQQVFPKKNHKVLFFFPGSKIRVVLWPVGGPRPNWVQGRGRLLVLGACALPPPKTWAAAAAAAAAADRVESRPRQCADSTRPPQA